MTHIWEYLCHFYEHLDSNKCLCKYESSQNISDTWNYLFQNAFNREDCLRREECKMLCIRILGLISEIYNDFSSKYKRVCAEIHRLYELFISEYYWNMFICQLKFSKNKYLVWIFIKSFSAILYSSSEIFFDSHLHFLLNSIKEHSFKQQNLYVLDFLSCIIDYKTTSHLNHLKFEFCDNINTTEAVTSSEALFQKFCNILSDYWSTLMAQFFVITSSSCQLEGLNRFLILWQKLVGKKISDDLVPIFLNMDNVNAFFKSACNLTVLSLHIYADIIMQFYTVYNKREPLQPEGIDRLEKTVIYVLNSNFFFSLPQDVHLNGFCGTKSKSESSEPGNSSKWDATMTKKITFIFLHILTDVKAIDLLSCSVQTIYKFLKEQNKISTCIDFHDLILDTFFDQDDILFGIMLALLRIYIYMKKENITLNDANELQLLNPHKIFLHFLKRIGFDHNELLSFLTSDETCFLSYLLQYLKLLQNEWETFKEIHSQIYVNHEEFVNSETATSHKRSQNISKLSKSISLVSYSSSSSDEEAPKSDISKIGRKLAAILTLSKLKNAILKLENLKEFPYNAKPLIILLEKCEKYNS